MKEANIMNIKTTPSPTGLPLGTPPRPGRRSAEACARLGLPRARVLLDQLHADRVALERRIKSRKRELRSTWSGPMAHAQRELLALKDQVTELYVLRAWLRGRFHLHDRLYCEAVARRVLPDYCAPEPSEPSLVVG